MFSPPPSAPLLTGASVFIPMLSTAKHMRQFRLCARGISKQVRAGQQWKGDGVGRGGMQLGAAGTAPPPPALSTEPTQSTHVFLYISILQVGGTITEILQGNNPKKKRVLKKKK